MKYRVAHLAVIVAGLLVVSPAFAQINTSGHDPPITVTSSMGMISYGDIIEISGKVDTHKSDVPVTLKVTGPQGNIITLRQLDVESDNTYSTTLNALGTQWNYDGRYVVKVQYGSEGTTNKTYLDLSGGADANPIGSPDLPVDVSTECSAGELAVGDACIWHTISGASVTGASTEYAGQGGNSLRVEINATEDGTLVLAPNAPSCSDANYVVLVDGQQWDDVSVIGDRVSVNFFAGNSVVEVVGACVVPEFGGIAAVMLAIALVAVIIASARGRIGIMPKY